MITVFLIHLCSCFFTEQLTKAFLPDMLNRNHGHVVNIASLAGVVGMNGLADYCASKSAVIGFTEALQYELRQLKRYGVHLTLVCPSYLGTGMFQDCVSRYKILQIH